MYAMRCINPVHLEVFPLGRKLQPAPRNWFLNPWKTMRKPGETTGKPRENLPETIGKPHICSSKVGKPMVSTVCFWLKANSMISGDRPIMTHLFLVLCNVESFLIEKEHEWLPNSIGIWILNACFAGSTSTKPICELFPDPISW